MKNAPLSQLLLPSPELVPFSAPVPWPDYADCAGRDPPVNVLHFTVMGTTDGETVIDKVGSKLSAEEDRLRALGIRMVNVVTCQGARPPLHHTFMECEGYNEDPMRRSMRPTFTHLLELPRLANYDLSRFPTINRDLHIYLGEAKVRCFAHVLRGSGSRGGDSRTMCAERVLLF